MEAAVNYWWAAVIAVLAIALIIWMVRRNQKDEKKFEQETIQSELKPEQHDEDKEIKP